MKTIGVGFIGAGDISLLHADAINSQPGVELIGVYDLDPDQTLEKSRGYNCRAFPSAEALIVDPAIEAVFVLTPLGTHRKYAIMVLEEGKHTFIEKPVGVNIEEIQDIKNAAETSGAICMLGHNYIYEPGVNRARDLVVQDKLGKIVSVYILTTFIILKKWPPVIPES